MQGKCLKLASEQVKFRCSKRVCFPQHEQSKNILLADTNRNHKQEQMQTSIFLLY